MKRLIAFAAQGAIWGMLVNATGFSDNYWTVWFLMAGAAWTNSLFEAAADYLSPKLS